MAYIRENGKLFHTRSLGNMGEDIATKFLISKGFRVISRNYLKPWGEIDIIATKDRIVHFFEVKSVTNVLISTFSAHKPEENVHAFKVKHIRRMIQTFFAEFRMPSESDFQFHVLSVFMDMNNRRARVKWIKNIILC